MRAVILSHRAADPERRSRYHALAARGAEVWLAVPHSWHPSYRETPYLSDSRDDGALHLVPVHVRGALADGAPARWNTRTISRLLRDIRPDLVQVEEQPDTQVAAVTTALARRLALPTVLLVQAPVPGATIMQRRYARHSLSGAGGIIATSSVVADQLAAVTHAHRAIIPALGVTPPPTPAVGPEESFVIGFVGRLVARRGLDVLLRACVKVLGDWRLLVAGSGPDQEPLEQLAERLGVAARVSWLGSRPAAEWPELWSSIHCLAVPSRPMAGGFDTALPWLLDCMAHGVPVVASDAGAMPELVEPAGRIVPADDPEALAVALRDLQQNPESRVALGHAVRRRVLEEFTPDALAARTMAAWDRVRARSNAATP